MKKVWAQMGILAFALSILVFYYIYLNMKWTEDKMMNRAQVARMLALLELDSEACEEFFNRSDKEKMPPDVRNNSWYEKYVAVVLENNWMLTDDLGNFLPGEAITYKDLKHIMNQFYINENMLSFSLKYRQSDGFVQKKHWLEVFNYICIGQQNVKKVERIICGSPENMSELSAWEVMTDDGIKIAEGISLEGCMNHRVEVYERDNHLLCITRLMSDEIVELEDAEYEQDNIRVILHSENKGYEHDFVQITSEEPFYVICGQDIWAYDAGEYVDFDMETQMFSHNIVVIRTENLDEKIKITSLERACGNPSYAGKIHLQKTDKGILIINELDIEAYVAGVIPSEMPISWGIEALKAQAVCARTFAKRSLSSQFMEYPANVDDTVASQVYNNQLACSESIRATKETEGLVLKNKNGLVQTYYFSTSCGHTSAPEDVWYNGEDNKEETSVMKFISDESVSMDLSQEDIFRAFIDRKYDVNYYEQDLPWFRWQVFISDEIIEEKLNTFLGRDIGQLNKIEIVDRGESGIIKTIQFEGDKDTCQVHGEYRIRQIFSPYGAELRPQKGEIVTDWKILPSGYFYMDALVEDGNCEGYLLHGGGYGHGCGMSQYGAMKMAEEGKDYKQILKVFFGNVDVLSMMKYSCTK